MKKIDFKKAVLLGFVCGNILTCGSAWAEMPKEKIYGPYEDLKVACDGNNFVTLRVWGEGTEVYYEDWKEDTPDGIEKVTRSLLLTGNGLISDNSPVKSEQEALFIGLKYIYDVIGKPKGDVPVIHLNLSGDRNGNAHGESNISSTDKYLDFAKYFVADGDVATSMDFYAGAMSIGLPNTGSSCYYSFGVLPENGVLENYAEVIIHEMFHIVGIGVARNSKTDAVELDGSIYKNYQLKGVSIYNRGLHDAFDQVSYVSDNEGKITKLISVTDYANHKNAGTMPGDTNSYFYMVANETESGNYFMPTNADGTVNTDSETYKILNGAKIAWPDDSGMPPVAGIPINGWEPDESGENIPELSHLELQNSLMSHQNYRNWGVLMEAELALLQDIGYATIDRSKFYGGSLYNSGAAKTALSEDFTSVQQYAIGYHVYGSNNTVNFGAAIQPAGADAVGIRVDGVSNNITVDEAVTLTGAKGTGVMFSYGNSHTLMVSAPVTVSGAGGIGLRFDFGDNMMGNGAEYRGSYICGAYDAENGRGWVNGGSLSALQGPLMTKVDVNADITGGEHAIYISKNAYVEELNISAENINGNITSEWNPTGTLYTAKEMGGTGADLKLNKAILGDINPATLMTVLNFKDDVNVNGNISGYHSLNMFVEEDKTVTVVGNVSVHSIGDEGSIVFSNGDGLISVKDTLNLEGTLQADKSVEIVFAGSGNNRLHNVNTVVTDNLKILTDDINATQIQVGNVTAVEKFIVSGTKDVSEQIVDSGSTLQQGLEKVAKVIYNAPNEEIDVKIAEGDLMGELQAKTYNYVLTAYAEKPNQSNKQLSSMNSSLQLGWRAQNNDLNKRMGELRLKNEEAGVWARMSRGENEGGGTKRQFNLYQVGYDHEIGSNWIGGVALSWNKGQTNTCGSTGYAKGEDETGSLGLYASRLNKDGTFVDLIVKYGRTSNDVDSYFATGMGSFDYHTPAMSASAEVGKRYQKGKWWLEPQAEFTYGFDRGAEYTTSNGLSVHQEAFKTAVGRLGLAAGVDFHGGNFYARASYLYDFEGKSDMGVQRGTQIRNYHDDMGGSWWEVGIGTNFKTGKDSYVYADVEKTYGGSMRTPWRWNLGIRYSF